MAANQTLSSKEASLFRQVIKHYEDKQYKRGIKAADQILKKNPKHGETLAMKGLIINSQGKTDEAFALCKEALTLNMKSHICWHVYGLLYRSAKNYEEAIKAYKFALRFEPDSAPIQRDLAILQAQTRDFKGYVASRKVMLQARPQIRQNWTALACANHLAGNLAEAENVLKTYEDTIKDATLKGNYEHSEAVMYRISIIAERGDYARALTELRATNMVNLDRLAYLECKAEFLHKLGEKEKAVRAYRKIIDRNPDNSKYYQQLIEALGISEDLDAQVKLYAEYAEKFPRSDAPKRLPLNILEGEAFDTAAKTYVHAMLNRGVPSTFHNLKALYVNTAKKESLEKIVLEYLEEQKSASEASDTKTCSGLYYLAQHYKFNLSRDLTKAFAYIDEALEIDAQNVDFHMTKARITKHTGDLVKAAEIMDYARSLDVKDRYINTKAVKYLLRSNQNEKALETIGLFTRPDVVGGPIADLLEMQCLWFITEDGQAHARNGDIGLALKRLQNIQNFFDIWQEDQIDFHTFVLRKGQMRAYVDMIRWADVLREHPFYSRAALSAVQVYLKMHDKPTTEAQIAADTKITKEKAKKAKKILAQNEKDAAGKAAKADPNKGDSEPTKVDEDPLGLALEATKTPLEEAMKFVTPLLQFSPKLIESQFAGFDVFVRRQKWLLALKCLKTMKELDPTNPKVHERYVKFLHLSTTAMSSEPPAVLDLIKATFESPADLAAYNATYLSEHTEGPAQLAGARALKAMDDEKAAEELIFKVLKETEDFNVAVEGLESLKGWWSARVGEYKEAAVKKFPNVTRLV